MNKKSLNKIPTGIKYLILIIVIILLVIIFNVVNNNMHNKPIEDPTQDNSATNVDNPNKEPATNIDNTNKEPITNPNKDDNQKNNDNDTIIGGGDNIDVTQYTIFDSYIITSSNTQYGNYGWKYFLIRSYSEFTNYINNYFVSYNNVDISSKLNTLKQEITSDFFKTGCVVIVVDYSLNEISGLIDNILVSDTTATISINRHINTTNSSKFVTHILPISSTSIRNIKVEYSK